MTRLITLALLIKACVLVHGWAGDWPQFRYDVGRTAASPHALPANLELCWTRKLPAPQPVTDAGPEFAPFRNKYLFW